MMLYAKEPAKLVTLDLLAGTEITREFGVLLVHVDGAEDALANALIR